MTNDGVGLGGKGAQISNGIKSKLVFESGNNKVPLMVQAKAGEAVRPLQGELQLGGGKGGVLLREARPKGLLQVGVCNLFIPIRQVLSQSFLLDVTYLVLPFAFSDPYSANWC